MKDIKKDPFEEYLKQTEPSRKELGYAWYTAMGVPAKVIKKIEGGI